MDSIIIICIYVIFIFAKKILFEGVMLVIRDSARLEADVRLLTHMGKAVVNK